MHTPLVQPRRSLLLALAILKSPRRVPQIYPHFGSYFEVSERQFDLLVVQVTRSIGTLLNRNAEYAKYGAKFT